MRRILFTVLVVFLLVGCSASEPVEVTRLVEIPVEVTRLVEVSVEVTRVVEVTRIPQAETDLATEGGFASSECEAFRDEVDNLVLRWDDAMEVASNTARISLSDHVVRMQEVRQDARTLDEAACAKQLEIKGKMIAMMDSGIDLFTTFMGESDDRDKQPSDFHRVEYIIAQDLFVDALAALENHENVMPRRIHYFVIGDTGFSMEYIDESGDFVEVEAEYGRLGFDEMPAVFSAVIPDGEPAAVRLYNPTYDNEEVTCTLLVNGIEADSETAEGYATCEL